ncbi:uncharacterized protein LOC107852965 [Capsicum annuum]|uniref:uncharacterized protein LOC107852965 n=1 Tax=Capsicum annuum TaxID=4072 RepID=UPI001FB145E3|nr:uncharacterized protein LOC107852965 [Capsicum annuum]
MANTILGGAFMHLHWDIVQEMLDNITVTNRGRHTRDSEYGGVGEKNWSDVSHNKSRQHGTFSSNTAVNPRNDSHCQAITTRSGKVTADPPVPIVDEKKNNNEPIDVKSNSKQNEGEEKVTEPVLKPIPKPLPPYPQRLKKKTRRCVVATRSFVKKKEDLGSFIIPCTIGSFNFSRALYDLGASINLTPFVIFKQLGLEAPKPTTKRLVMVASFIFPANFVVLDYELDFQVPIIHGRPFLATRMTLIYLELRHLMLRLNDEQVIINVCKSIRQVNELRVIFVINVHDEKADSFHDIDVETLWDDGSDAVIPITENLGIEAVAVVIINFYVDGI